MEIFTIQKVGSVTSNQRDINIMGQLNQLAIIGNQVGHQANHSCNEAHQQKDAAQNQ